ncbi:MAG: SulP family inorganic anion transporter [Verrucomicrobia bacterium]|nr:SulP family inorganic anion transporter [Verrucomicrobiota bacterium]
MSVSAAPTKTRGNLVADMVAGLTTGVANIPDALALAILAGANPVQGLYALMAGTPLAAIFGSSAFMNVSATSALAIAAGMALTGYTGDAHATAIATLTLLTGLIMLLAGLLKLGRLLRFVANSVVIGFLTGVSINVILSQLGDFTGFLSEYSNKVIKAIDTVLHLGQIDPQTTAIGALTVAVILLVDRTRLRNFSLLAGMVAGSAALIVLSATGAAGWTEVQQVKDIAVIPTSLPLPKLPDFKLVPALLLDAMVLAIIGLVQGAGVSKTYANPDGDYPNPSRDFTGQGAANIGAGLLQGMPIGGAIASTALNISAGAKSRWANIFSGLLVGVAVLLFSRAVSLVAMPAMAGLLIVAGYHSIKNERIKDVWAIGWSGRVVMLVTLTLTLAIPLQLAVFLGVLLSIFVHFFVTSSDEVRVMQRIPNPDGTVTEGPVPAELPSNAVTLLQIYGNMTFAGAETLESLLPSPKTAERPVVILRLRAQEGIGSSFIGVLERYAQQLKAHGGTLMVAGVNPKVKGQLDRTGTASEILGAENVFVSSTTLGASTRDAYAAAERWLQERVESQDAT